MGVGLLSLDRGKKEEANARKGGGGSVMLKRLLRDTRLIPWKKKQGTLPSLHKRLGLWRPTRGGGFQGGGQRVEEREGRRIINGRKVTEFFQERRKRFLLFRPTPKGH